MISRRPGSIVELGELSGESPTDMVRVATRGAANPMAGQPDLGMAFWLFGLAAMVLGQVLLGGITRLSESGLSIMEWAPIMGVVPPLSDAEWQRVFAIYRQTGEYRLVNPDIDKTVEKGFETVKRLSARLREKYSLS